MADLALLERLCRAHGISGFEGAVRDIIRKEAEPYAEKITVDALGNLIVTKRGASRAKVKLMLDAHMDEVGMIVTYITEEGLLKFSCVGGIDRRVLCGKHVVVNEKIPGVIGARPIHLLDGGEREKSVPVEDLSIDIGASSREEAAEVVRLGDPVTFWSVFDASHGMVKSKAIDDRAGCAILLDLIKKDLPYDMTFVFSVQEEIGLRGAQTAAYAVAPEAAIVVESTTAADIAGVEPGRQVCHVGKGPVVSFMDRGTIYDQGYFQTAFQTAQELQIPCQTKEAVAGGNNAGAIHKSRGGVRTVAVSLPCRYLHSAVGLISQADFHHAEALVEQLAEKIAGGKSDR